MVLQATITFITKVALAFQSTVAQGLIPFTAKVGILQLWPETMTTLFIIEAMALQ